MSIELDRIPRFRNANDLLPAIAQDASSGRVLMLGWMNQAAFDETVKTNTAVYFSRSRGRLWRKGETSGHVQHVVQVLVDCDADTILLRVQQQGAACHEGYASCFYREWTANDAKWRIIEPREFDPHEVYGDANREI